jgi:predicted Zn finger-like uncharacterized protein
LTINGESYMSQRTVCPACGTSYAVAEGVQGKKTRCKKCNQVFRIVLASLPAAGASPSTENPFSTFQVQAPSPTVRKKASPNRKAVVIALGVLVLVVIAGALVAIFWGKGGVLPLVSGANSRVTDATFQQVKLGMSLAEVQGILGKGTRLPDDEVPAALKEQIDNPEVAGKIDWFEPRGWYQWVGSQGTIFVGLSERNNTDRVTVLAYAKPGSLKLECSTQFGKTIPETKPGKSSPLADAGKEEVAKPKPDAPAPSPSRIKPTDEQLRQALTQENYAKLRKGMTEQEVKDILGPPVTSRVVERHAGFEVRQAIWQLGQSFIIVAFQNGKLSGMDSGDGSGGPLPSAKAPVAGTKKESEPERRETSYKQARLEEVRLEYRGKTVLNFVLKVEGKKINVLPWEHVKFFNVDGKEIPRGNWGPYLKEGKTVLDVITIRMNSPELGGEVELIKEWRIVKQ